MIVLRVSVLNVTKQCISSRHIENAYTVYTVVPVGSILV